MIIASFINFSTEKKKSLHLKQHPIQRVNPKNEKCPNTGGNCGGYISIIGFFKIVFAIDKTTKTFNWVKTSVASRYNTTRPLIGRAHTRNKTELTIIFSLPFRPAYWPLPSSSNERKRERERNRASCSSRERYLRTALSVSLAPTTLFNFVGFPGWDLDRKARLRLNRNFPWNSENTRVLRKTRGQTE